MPQPRVRFSRAAALGLALAFAVACRHAPADEEPIDPKAPVILIFTNESLLEADVYSVVGNNFRHLGIVSSGKRNTFVVPFDIVARGSLNVAARQRGTRDIRTRDIQSSGSMLIRPGDSVVVRLPIGAHALDILPE